MAAKPMFGQFPITSGDENLHVTKGLSSTIGALEPSDTFGDSGDMFDHEHWRGLFGLLSSTKSGMRFLLGLSQKLLLRGQNEKILHKSKAVRYNFNLDSLTAEERRASTFWEGKQTINIYINYPTDASRVSATDLTPERTKCLLRLFIVPEMMKARRLPATSMAIGYGKLVCDFQKIMLKHTSITNLHVLLSASNEEEKEEAFPEMSKLERDAWLATAAHVVANSLAKYMNLVAAYGGSVSSKEIYSWDEEMICGVTFWSGLHAMMTDISNKNKASYVTQDVRARYESSSFYDDFKRKMAARKMSIVNGHEYIAFLQSMAGLLPLYIFSSAQIKTQEEVQVIDSVMQRLTALKQNSEGLYRKLATQDSDITTHTNPEMVAASIMNIVGDRRPRRLGEEV